LRATGAPVTDTWVVMGLNTPAGFWVTMVLVTELWTRLTVPEAVGERLGRAVVTRGPLGLKLTAAMAGATETLAPATGSTVPGLGAGLEVRLTGLEIAGFPF